MDSGWPRCWGSESSCDETAAAVLRADGTHPGRGGAEPARRARALWRRGAGDRRPRPSRTTCPAGGAGDGARPGWASRDLAGVAATAGPGLIGGLIVGSPLGKGIALAHGLPFVAVNHLEAHALTARCRARGGARATSPSCCCWSPAGIASASRSRASAATARLGTTLDDAAGRGLRQVGQAARPALAGRAGAGAAGDAGRSARAFALPRPLLGRAGCDFSFSGLKTAVAHAGAAAAAAAEQDRGRHRRRLPGRGRRGAGRPGAACARHAARARRRRCWSAGGVAANQGVRAALAGAAAQRGLPLVAPPIRALHRQRRHGRLGRDRAAAAGPGGRGRPCAAAALAAGGDGGQGDRALRI